MMNSNEEIGKMQYLHNFNYEDSVMLKMKGLELKFSRISTVVTTIDVSNNNLKGEIPEVIGDLVSLQCLNLTHNNFTGHIPPSLARNPGLCGSPLSKTCGDDEAPSQPPPRMVQDGGDSEYIGTFGWAMVSIEYGCRMVIGLVDGYRIIIARNLVWLLRFAR
ncbi:hypothetical protein Nepgr_016303 [Nepenthes gracilis]|uniref:Uncharacterized protein n=1 Tax=Nepenthes gracilis TaxID=150966 RepID=A0AAD3SQ61_NEPGR|nr:hypothetical protein Nepgr_016303 [Nepenthes gracilis]